MTGASIFRVAAELQRRKVGETSVVGHAGGYPAARRVRRSIVIIEALLSRALRNSGNALQPLGILVGVAFLQLIRRKPVRVDVAAVGEVCAEISFAVLHAVLRLA